MIEGGMSKRSRDVGVFDSSEVPECQETRTPVTFFSYFSHYGHSFLSISHYISPSHTAQ